MLSEAGAKAYFLVAGFVVNSHNNYSTAHYRTYLEANNDYFLKAYKTILRKGVHY